MNIQTPPKFEQKNPEELKYFSSVNNSVDKIEIAKKISHFGVSLSKPSNFTECSFKPVKVYQRPKTRPVNKLRLNVKEILDPKIKKDQIISVQDSSSDDEEDKRSKKLESSLNQVL